MADDESRLGAWPGARGYDPQKAADEITEAAKIENIDTDAIIAAYKKKGTRIVPLVHALVGQVSEETGCYVHWSSTTQDVIDTGLVLQYRQAIVILERAPHKT